MSVLIKGIDIPKGNITKVDVIFHLEEDASLMSIRENIEPSQVVEVPTPHGRLIDADEVPYFASAPWKAIATQSEIERMPTIIEAEEGEEE